MSLFYIFSLTIWLVSSFNIILLHFTACSVISPLSVTLTYDSSHLPIHFVWPPFLTLFLFLCLLLMSGVSSPLCTSCPITLLLDLSGVLPWIFFLGFFPRMSHLFWNYNTSISFFLYFTSFVPLLSTSSCPPQFHPVSFPHKRRVLAHETVISGA